MSKKSTGSHAHFKPRTKKDRLENPGTQLRILERVYPYMPEGYERILDEATGTKIDRNKIRAWAREGKVPWWADELNRTRWLRACDRIARHIITGKTIDWNEIGAQYKPSDAIPRAAILRLLKNGIFQMDVNNRIDQLMSELGLSHEEGVGMLREAAEMAREKGDAKALQSIAKEILTLTGAYAMAKSGAIKGRNAREMAANAQQELAAADRPKLQNILEAISGEDALDADPINDNQQQSDEQDPE